MKMKLSEESDKGFQESNEEFQELQKDFQKLLEYRTAITFLKRRMPNECYWEYLK